MSLRAWLRTYRRDGEQRNSTQERSRLWSCPHCKRLRWPVRLSGFGALVLVVLVWGGWQRFPIGTKDERFMARVQETLRGDRATEGDITLHEMQSLVQLARQLGLSSARTAHLLQQEKTAYVNAKREILQHLPPGTDTMTGKERSELCNIAETMQMLPHVQECVVRPEVVVASLEHGEFPHAKLLAQQLPDDPLKARLLATLHTPLNLELTFQYQRGTESPSSIFPLGAPALHDLTLTHKDNYRFFLSVAAQDTYVYVFQQDYYGQITRLFPDPIWSRVDNPLRPGVTYSIPPGDKEWLYLDALPPQQETAIQETLYIIASPWPAEDIEALYGEMYRATSQSGRADAISQFLARLRLRADNTVQAVYYQEFTFKHEG